MCLASLALLLSAAAQPARPAEPIAPVVREIKAPGLRLPGRASPFGKPTRIAGAADLARTVPDKGERDRLGKQVDFKKEYLLLFTWFGSGGDRLGFRPGEGEDGVDVVFVYTRGRTRDFRRHVRVFALPGKTTWRLGE